MILYFPTVLWLLGFLEFHLTILLRGPVPRAQGWSVGVACLFLLSALVSRRASAREWARIAWSDFRAGSFAFRALVVLVFAMFALAGIESRLPPHLLQEYDAINYHMGLARQHLLSGSLAHLDWSTADLMPMVFQWGLAPSWFFTAFPHKVTQFVFALWAFFCLLRLGRLFRAGGGPASWIPALAVFSSHAVMIQLGTAMLDLAQLYLLLAAIEGALTGKRAWAVLHLALFATFKAFTPLQTAALLLFAGLATYVTEREAFAAWGKRAAVIVGGAALLSLLLFARTFSVGLERAGTPLFPFGVCQIRPSAPGCQGEAGAILRDSAARLVSAKDAYGEGRGPVAFVKHFWKVAVPEKGVNNAFDYPLGLPWLLLCVLAGFALPTWFRERRLPFVLWLALGFWATWWMGSQQSRWLYPALALGWLGTTGIQARASERALCSVLALGASLSLVSELRAFRADLFRPRAEVHERERAKVAWEADGATLKRHESLYADRPARDVSRGDRTWVLR